MAFEKCFQKICPAINETFSFRNSPCRLEQSSKPNSTPLVQLETPGEETQQERECPNKLYCEKSSKYIDSLLEGVYGRYKISMSEPSSSIIVRSEHQYHRDERRRLSLRKHMYEVRHSESYNGTDCSRTKYSESDVFGSYLGFIDLRTHYKESPLAMGLLVPPRKFREDVNVSILTGEYGPLFGAHGFSSTVYVMQDPGTGGARCVAACIIMSLSMLADRAAVVVGPFTLTHLANIPETEGVTFSDNCLGRATSIDSPSVVKVTGLNPLQCEGLMQHDGFNISAKLHQIGVIVDNVAEDFKDSVVDRGRKSMNHLMKRLIEAYVCARYPVTIFVDTNTWWGTDQYGEDPHAVTVIGVRRNGNPYSDAARIGDDVVSLITHDPGLAPFYECPTDKVFEAMWRFNKPQDKQPPIAYMVVATEKKITKQAHDCFEELNASPYRYSFFPYWNRHADDHYLASLNKRRSLKNGHQPILDFRFVLHHRDDLLDFLTQSDTRVQPSEKEGAKMRRTKAAKVIEDLLPALYYWSIAGYSNGEVRDVWLFDAAAPLNDTTSDEWQAVHIPGCNARVLVAPSSPALVADSKPASKDIKPSKIYPPTVGGEGLSCSVLTSSTTRGLDDLVSEVTRISNVQRIDLMVLRDADISELSRYVIRGHGEETARQQTQWADTRTDSLIADESNCALISDWFYEKCDKRVKVSALATYFPNVTSMDSELREVAVNAIANSARIAIDLYLKGLMDAPIIEIVSGTILDRCVCPECKSARAADGKVSVSDRMFCYTREVKRRVLYNGLSEIVSSVVKQPLLSRANLGYRQERIDEAVKRFAIALELEPGPDYVLNDQEALVQIMDDLKQFAESKAANQIKLRQMSAHVGLNLDIAHMKIAGISADSLAPYCDKIVHAHIADHPRMHTIDQTVGKWTMVERHDGGYYPYLRLLSNRLNFEKSDLPFSGAIAIELEGCHRIFRIHHSASAVNHMVEVIRNYPEAGRQPDGAIKASIAASNSI